MVITVPNIINIIATALLRIFSSIRLANLALITPLPAALNPMINPGISLMLPCRAYPNAPEQDVIAIRRDEVPIAMRSGIFKTKIRISNIMAPPPEPKIPDIIPTAKPKIRVVNIF